MLKKITFFTGIVMLICSMSRMAGAAVVGPVDPVTKFPVYYQDDKGMYVAGPPPAGDGLKAPTNIFAPVIAGNPISASTGFGLEYFYWLAKVGSRTFRTRSGKAEVTFGLMATYAGGTPQAGQQAVFSRIRFQAVLPAPGAYTLDHPYGTESFSVTTDDGHRRSPSTLSGTLGPPGILTRSLPRAAACSRGFW